MGISLLVNDPVGINRKGFTLIELMIVVAIIGILASIAIPNFIRFQAKAKQVEVMTNLGTIFISQETSKAESNIYSNAKADLDWAAAGTAKQRYTYSIASGTTSAFTATGTGNIDNDAVVDAWQIDEARALVNTTNDVID